MASKIATDGRLQASIIKKCDMSAHRPDSNSRCAAGACQHTCRPDGIGRCKHAWTVRYLVNGVQREKSFKDDLNAAKRIVAGSGLRKAQAFQLELSRGKRAEGATYVDPKAGDGNFGDAVLAFIASAAKTSGRTKESYLSNYRSNVAPAFGALRVSQVAAMRSEVETLLNVTMLAMSVNARRLACRLITGTLDAAVVADRISRHRIGGIDLADREVTEDDEPGGFVFITDAQVSALAGGCQAQASDGKRARALPGVGVAAWLQRTMGLRICEALGVEKSDFIIKSGKRFLRLKWQATRDGKNRVPLKKRKAGQFRDIPVPASVWRTVRAMPDGPLCPGRSTKYLPYGTAQVRFSAITAALGITGFTTHSLRHQFASESLEAGMNVVDLADVLGHADASVTLRTYVHALPDAADRTRAMMDARWSLPLAA